jgi:hypothetical protein
MSKPIETSTVKMPKSFYEVRIYWEEDDENDWSYIKGSLSVEIEKYVFTQKRKKYKTIPQLTYHYKTKTDKYGLYNSIKLEDDYFKGVASHKAYGASKKSAIAKAVKKYNADVRESKKEAKNGDEYEAELLKKVYPMIRSGLTRLEKKL